MNVSRSCIDLAEPATSATLFSSAMKMRVCRSATGIFFFLQEHTLIGLPITIRVMTKSSKIILLNGMVKRIIIIIRQSVIEPQKHFSSLLTILELRSSTEPRRGYGCRKKILGVLYRRLCASLKKLAKKYWRCWELNPGLLACSLLRSKHDTPSSHPQLLLVRSLLEYI